MRMFGRVLLTAVTVLGLVGASAVPAFADEGGNLTDFSSMKAVTGAAVGTINDRGIKGGGLPWVISTGTGTVSQQGVVDVTVTGLVIPLLGGINPAPKFEATVSCLTPDGVVNVSTGSADASLSGNSHIHATVDLPRPCKDPIVFVANFPAGRWFAMSNSDSQP